MLEHLEEGYSKLEWKKKDVYATRKHVAFAAAIPVAASVGIAAYQHFNNSVKESINVLAQPPVEHYTLTESYTPLLVNTVPQQTGVIADKSLEMLATILDPVIDILIAFSLPVASVMIVGAFFLFMIGQSEKAWDIIFKSAMGYILIQLSPIFLEILKTIGEAI